MGTAPNWWDEQEQHEKLERYTPWGRMIKQRLWTLNWTDQMLADKVYISKSALGAAMRGERPLPPTAQLKLIADLLDLVGEELDQYRATCFSYTAWRGIPERFPGLTETLAHDATRHLQQKLHETCLEWCRKNPDVWAVEGGLIFSLSRQLQAYNGVFQEKFVDARNDWGVWSMSHNSQYWHNEFTIGHDSSIHIRDNKLICFHNTYNMNYHEEMISPHTAFYLRDFLATVTFEHIDCRPIVSRAGDKASVEVSLIVHFLDDTPEYFASRKNYIEIGIAPEKQTVFTRGRFNGKLWRGSADVVPIARNGANTLTIGRNGQHVLFFLNGIEVYGWKTPMTGVAKVGIKQITYDLTHKPYTEMSKFTVLENATGNRISDLL